MYEVPDQETESSFPPPVAPAQAPVDWGNPAAPEMGHRDGSGVPAGQTADWGNQATPPTPAMPPVPGLGLYARAHPLPPYVKPHYPSNGLAAWSLVLGIVSLSGVVVGGLMIILAVPAVVCGIFALRAVRRHWADNLVLSWIGVLVGAAAVLVNLYMLTTVFTLWGGGP